MGLSHFVSKFLPVFWDCWQLTTVSRFACRYCRYQQQDLSPRSCSIKLSRWGMIWSTSPELLFICFFRVLYYLLRRSLLPCLGATLCADCFIPVLLILAGILILRLWRWGLPRLSNNRLMCLRNWSGTFPANDVALCTEFFWIWSVITAIEARALPAFSEDRDTFFDDDPLWFWLFGQHSGLLPNVFEHPLAVVGLSCRFFCDIRTAFPKLSTLPAPSLLPQIILVSFGLFCCPCPTLQAFLLPRDTRSV